MLGPQLDGTLRVEKVEPLKDLGWVNDWRLTPEIVMFCREAKHYAQSFYKVEKAGNCIMRTTCTVCNYTYRVDSSD